MKLAEVREILIGRLEKDLKEDLFFWSKNKLYFIKKDQSKTQIIDFLFAGKGTSIQVEPTIRVKINEIEEFYKPYFTRDFQYFESVQTIGNSLFKIKKFYSQGLTIDPDEVSYYLLENDNDIINTTNGLLTLVREYGYRYFNDTSNSSKVDKLLNENLREISIHYWLYPMRAIMGIIAAHKANNPKLKEYIETYRAELNDAEEFYKNEFEQVANKILAQKSTYLTSIIKTTP